MKTLNEITFLASQIAEKECQYWAKIGIHSQTVLDNLFKELMFKIVNRMLNEKCDG